MSTDKVGGGDPTNVYTSGNDINIVNNAINLNSTLATAATFTSNNLLFKNAADSTTALQVQNAAGANEFIVDTANQKVAVGPAAVPANGVLTIGTNTTTAAGGLYFGTDTNLYRSAQILLKKTID